MNFISISGFVFGVTGTILSVLSLLNQRNNRMTDLKMRLGQEINQVEIDIQQIEEIFKDIVQRKKAIALATGSMGGYFEKWVLDFNADNLEFKQIITNFEAIKSNTKNLPKSINEMNKVLISIQRLASKYNAEIRKIETAIADQKRSVYK